MSILQKKQATPTATTPVQEQMTQQAKPGKTPFTFTAGGKPQTVNLTTTPAVESPTIGRIFKDPNPAFLNRELLSAYNSLPLSDADRAKLIWLLSHGDSADKEVNKVKLELYRKLMKGLKRG